MNTVHNHLEWIERRCLAKKNISSPKQTISHSSKGISHSGGQKVWPFNSEAVSLLSIFL